MGQHATLFGRSTWRSFLLAGAFLSLLAPSSQALLRYRVEGSVESSPFPEVAEGDRFEFIFAYDETARSGQPPHAVTLRFPALVDYQLTWLSGANSGALWLTSSNSSPGSIDVYENDFDLSSPLSPIAGTLGGASRAWVGLEATLVEPVSFVDPLGFRLRGPLDPANLIDPTFLFGLIDASARCSIESFELLSGLRSVPSDLDGDGTSDTGVYYAPTGEWFFRKSTVGFERRQFGFGGTVPVLADFDGDETTDIAVYHDPTGIWYILESGGRFRTQQFGHAGALPVPGDYDADGRDDLAVYYPPSGTWSILQSSAGFRRQQFGFPGTIPVPGDYDGDGRKDLCVFHPPSGMWYLLKSTDGFSTFRFGHSEVQPISGYFDDDFIEDIGVYNNGAYLWCSIDEFVMVQEDARRSVGIPVVADTDGDGIDEVLSFDPVRTTWTAPWPEGNVVWGIPESRGRFTTLGGEFGFGFRGVVPISSPLVGGISTWEQGAGYTYIQPGHSVDGPAWVWAEGKNHPCFRFSHWADGSRANPRNVGGSAQPRRYTAVFKHWLPGRWQGAVRGVPSTLEISKYRGGPGVVGELFWPSGGYRGVGGYARVVAIPIVTAPCCFADALSCSLAVTLTPEGGDRWEMQAAPDGNTMFGTGFKRNGETYPVWFNRK